MYKSYAGIYAILYPAANYIWFYSTCTLYFKANYNSKKAKIKSYLGGGGLGIYKTKYKYHVSREKEEKNEN